MYKDGSELFECLTCENMLFGLIYRKSKLLEISVCIRSVMGGVNDFVVIMYCNMFNFWY